MKIVIATSGRAHLLDYATELQRLGHQVEFYSTTPNSNFKKYGLQEGGHSLLWLMAPLEYFRRKLRTRWAYKLHRVALDSILRLILPKCDIFIAQSPFFSNTMKKAKSRGAITILDRGSSHVDEYDRLQKIYKGTGFHNDYLTEDRNQYQIADHIMVGSSYVKSTFIKYGVDAQKLFVNNYGFNTKLFHPTEFCPKDSYNVIAVGQWSKRKGSDILSQVISQRPDLRFLHIGSVVDEPLPENTNFKHEDAVPESDLIKFYQKSQVFILLSRDEGLALVLLQALACGLPMVITNETGGKDVQDLLDNKEFVQIVNTESIDNIMVGINKALLIASSQSGKRQYGDSALSHFTWETYGERLNEYLMGITAISFNSSEHHAHPQPKT